MRAIPRLRAKRAVHRSSALPCAEQEEQEIVGIVAQQVAHLVVGLRIEVVGLLHRIQAEFRASALLHLTTQLLEGVAGFQAAEVEEHRLGRPVLEAPLDRGEAPGVLKVLLGGDEGSVEVEGGSFVRGDVAVRVVHSIVVQHLVYRGDAVGLGERAADEVQVGAALDLVET